MEYILVIHGGTTFANYEEYLQQLRAKEFDVDRMKLKDWKENLPAALGDRYEVWSPRMPNPNNAKYKEWSIWFTKALELIPEPTVLLGHSLGGIFLAKYLAEEKIKKKIRATFLVAAPHSAVSEHPLESFTLPDSLNQLEEQGGQIFLYHSTDDPIVSFASFEHYQKDLPQATARTFLDRQHFNGEQFAEIVDDLLKLSREESEK